MMCRAVNFSMPVYLGPYNAWPSSVVYRHNVAAASKKASRSASVNVRNSRFTYLHTRLTVVAAVTAPVVASYRVTVSG